MSVITYSNARENFRTIIDKVNEDSEPYIITTKDNINAVLISESDYNSMMETLYLLSNPSNAKHLTESIHQVNQGKTIEVNLDDQD